MDRSLSSQISDCFVVTMIAAFPHLFGLQLHIHEVLRYCNVNTEWCHWHTGWLWNIYGLQALENENLFQKTGVPF